MRGGAFLNGKEGRVGFRKNNTIMMNDFKNIKVAVAGTGYVGLSIATLLSQHHHVTAVDVIPEKVEKLNNKISPIQDDYIEKYCYIATALARTSACMNARTAWFMQPMKARW